MTVVFAVATAAPAIFGFLKLHFAWPLLDDAIVDADGKLMDTSFSFNVFGNPGTLLLLSGIIVAVVYHYFNENGRYSLSFGQPVSAFGDVVSRMKFSALTIILVLALAYTMNYSGQTIAIGEFVSSAGSIFALFAPVLGWIGTAVTGSDTSANALFANLQVAAAERISVNPDLMLAANTAGGVVGKMISPQSLAIAATAVNMEGKESVILKNVVGYSVAFLAFVCVIVFLMTNVLGFLVP